MLLIFLWLDPKPLYIFLFQWWIQLEVAPDSLPHGHEVPTPRLRGVQAVPARRKVRNQRRNSHLNNRNFDNLFHGHEVPMSRLRGVEAVPAR